MLETVVRFGFITEKLHVKMPCGILYGNRELSVLDSDVSDILSQQKRDNALKVRIFMIFFVLIVSIERKSTFDRDR